MFGVKGTIQELFSSWCRVKNQTVLEDIVRLWQLQKHCLCHSHQQSPKAEEETNWAIMSVFSYHSTETLSATSRVIQITTTHGNALNPDENLVKCVSLGDVMFENMAVSLPSHP